MLNPCHWYSCMYGWAEKEKKNEQTNKKLEYLYNFSKPLL